MNLDRLSAGRALTIIIGLIAIAAILGLAIALMAQAKASDAQTRAASVAKVQADEAKQLAAANQAQAQLLRDAICGTFRDVAKSPLSSASSDFGKKLIIDTGHGADVAQCPR